jgi:hypothetical protein
LPAHVLYRNGLAIEGDAIYSKIQECPNKLLAKVTGGSGSGEMPCPRGRASPNTFYIVIVPEISKQPIPGLSFHQPAMKLIYRTKKNAGKRFQI